MDFDLFIIGAGSAGVRAGRMAAGLGKKVAVAESRYLGGTCVNVGCVPKKLFVYASEFPHVQQEAKGFGLDIKLNQFDWPTLRDNKTKEIERLNGIYKNLLDNSGVTTVWGHARLTGPNFVEIEGTTYTAEKILLATGGWPTKPDIPGKEHLITSNEIFYLEKFPTSAVVIGSGYIAVEFAGILNGLGCDTQIASRSGRLLRGFDESTRSIAQREILKKGLKLIPEQPSAVIKNEQGYEVQFASGIKTQVDLVVCATGRTPNIDNLGIQEQEIELDNKGFIAVNDQYQTNIESVYAMGDLIDTPQLTPVALEEAMTFLRQQYQDDSSPLNYDNIATAIFSQPCMATVGLSEESALQKGFELDVYESEFKALKHTLSGSDERTYMKLLVDKKTDKVLGAHMLGEHASEILQGIAIAMKAGATKAHFDATIGIHPSSAEEFVTMRTPSKR
jgi:glutathione reductase (NADPH)